MKDTGSKFRCLLAGAAFAAAMGSSGPARAEVSVNINLGPPPIVVSAPPAVVMIPGSQVHFVPDPTIDVFFYGGYWWSPRGQQWYRARAYNGPWGMIEYRRVPPAILYMPQDYRARYERERHVPYGQWKKDRAHWDRENRKAQKKWEKEREKEWKESQKGHGKGDKHGNHGGDGGGDHGKHGR
ncbi:MAG: hypothetical protein H6Q82_1590 [Deltaproteobacteria bacterium]|nr:hypothetical protein [Deltaproteobacteria bacterium]MBP2683606.1 hypothetical protein [Deltaproteobacteria bacterium]